MTKPNSDKKKGTSLKRRPLFRFFMVIVLLFAGILLAICLVPFDLTLLDKTKLSSVKIVDREGRLLREVLGKSQERHEWVELEEISKPLRLATIHAEDKRFWSHPGLDPAAITRAFYYNVRAGKVVTGASTITQQTVKMVRPTKRRRGLRVKLSEMLWAVRLEVTASKKGILTQYFNRVPYGNQLRGVHAASWMYFNKSPSEVTLAEAALLAPITRAPSVLNPYNKPGQLKRLQRRLLTTMLSRGVIGKDEYTRALSQEVKIFPRRGAIRAPHFTEYVLSKVDRDVPQKVHTTLDMKLQKDVEAILSASLKRIRKKNANQGAVVVLDTQSAEVLSWVGSSDYWSKKKLGANDGVLAVRQPGSALKPFVYARLLDANKPSSSVFFDWQVQFQTPKGAYIPENYDHKFHGPVFMREALASSLNIPAVLAVKQLGVETTFETFRGLGFKTMTQPAQHYGLGLALGNAEVRLIDLATAYTALGRGGVWSSFRVVKGAGKGVKKQVFSPEVSAIILDMLGDDRARAIGFGTHNVFYMPFKLAAKTGTSVGYRDNWAVAMTPEYTVAVWVGNFDGKPMINSSGVTGAGPIARQVIQTLYPKASAQSDVPWFKLPPGVSWVNVCQYSGHKPTQSCPKTIKRLMRDTQYAALPTDDMHHTVQVDRRDGLLSHDNCDEANIKTQLVYKVPGAWLEWAEKKQLPLYPMVYTPLCGQVTQATTNEISKTNNARLAILHPLAGDVFVLDQDVSPKSQQMKLRASVPPHRVHETMSWFVDGKIVARVKAPFRAFWQLQPGRHVIGFGKTQPEQTLTIEVQ